MGSAPRLCTEEVSLGVLQSPAEVSPLIGRGLKTELLNGFQSLAFGFMLVQKELDFDVLTKLSQTETAAGQTHIGPADHFRKPLPQLDKLSQRQTAVHQVEDVYVPVG